MSQCVLRHFCCILNYMKSIGDIVLIIIGFILIFTLVGFFASNIGTLSNLTKNVPNLTVTNTDTKSVVKDTCGITLFSPLVNDTIQSPIQVRGYAETKCGWTPNKEGYLGTATLYSSRNTKIAETKLSIIGGNVNGILNFEGNIVYNDERYSYGGEYTVQIVGANSKGVKLTRTIAVKVPDSNDPYVGTGCQIAGCNMEICGEKGQIITTSCQFKPEYACYQSQYARCEKQSNNQCGWSSSGPFRQCLSRY